jgi:hypothetical protein
VLIFEREQLRKLLRSKTSAQMMWHQGNSGPGVEDGTLKELAEAKA